VRYLLGRFASILPVLLGVSVLVFLMVRLIPGDPAKNLAGERATAEMLEAIRAEHGLDKPLPAQYAIFLGNLVQGDLGTSVHTYEPVSHELARRFPATMELAFSAILLAALVGVPLGILASLKPNSLVDAGSMGTALVGVSVPVFCLGYLLIILVGDYLPYSGRMDEDVLREFQPRTSFYVLEAALRFNGTALWDALEHLCLPALALSSVPLAVVARITRSSMLEVLGQDYVRTAKAKGLSHKRVVLKHALRNALIPILTVIGLQVTNVLGAAVIIETVFAWPGLGEQIVLATIRRDYPTLQFGVLGFAAVVVTVNLAVDLLYSVVDPRVRVGG